jgi:DNA-binding LacI/PurR family transcriptional regulator
VQTGYAGCIISTVTDQLSCPAGPNAPSKYRHIFETLRDAITSGDYRVGQRLPSESELVRTFGTSRVTVNRALRELQLGGYIERRVGSGSFVRPLDSKTYTFGLLIPGLGQTEIFEPICAGMAQAQHAEHVRLWGRWLAESHAREEHARDVCRQLVEQHVSGVFFAPLELTPDMNTLNASITAQLDQAGIPVVLLDRDILAFPLRSKYDVVGIDNRRAGYVLTEHLVAQGRRRIVFVARPLSAPTVDARIAGYREALAAGGAAFEPSFLCRVEPDADESLVQLLDHLRPDAIVCANDFTAAQLMKSIIRVRPSAVATLQIAAFDDVKYASLLPMPLTTIRQPCAAIGAAAVVAMTQRLRNPRMPARDILLDFTLVVR